MALVASCLFAQGVFAQRSGSGGFGEGGYRAAAPGYVGRPKLRVVVRPGLRWTGQPRLIYYPYSDLPYVPVGTPLFYLAGHAGKIDSCWGWGRVPVAELLRRILTPAFSRRGHLSSARYRDCAKAIVDVAAGDPAPIMTRVFRDRMNLTTE